MNSKAPGQGQLVVEVFKVFGGLLSNADPTDVANNQLWKQSNLLILKEGQLTPRPGIVELQMQVKE